MTKIERSALVSYSDQQMFHLVNDIASYPEFMPGCKDAQVLERGEGWLTARLDLAKMGMRQSFTTKNLLDAPRSMRLTLVDGPFKSLEGLWLFQRLNDQACKVVFWLEFEVANALMAMALPKFMEHIASEQVDAVCMRARQVYGR